MRKEKLEASFLSKESCIFQAELAEHAQPAPAPASAFVGIRKKKSNSSFRMNQGVMKIGRNKGSHVISSGISVSLRVEFLL